MPPKKQSGQTRLATQTDGRCLLAQLGKLRPELRVVTDYVPRVHAAGSHAPALAGFLDPTTGRAIPLEQAGDHLRVETLDPTWAEQRAKYLARQASSGLADGDEVAENLRRLAASRSDVFRAGGTAAEAPPGKRARS